MIIRNAPLTYVVFALCFVLGVGSALMLNQLSTDDQPAVSEDKGQVYQGRISEVAAQVSPSIVGISNMQKDGDLFSQDSVESTGSGVILDHEGYIITNNHVVKGADSITVTLADGNEEQAQIVGTDPRTDLAVIKIEVNNHVTPIIFGDSNKLIVGEEVIAIGNPLGLRFARSVTAGIVSGLNRLVSTEEGFLFKLIQTDAAINPGNSGGALVNLNGELIGINTIKIAEKGFEGMGFSIPSNQVNAVVKDIKKHGKVTRPLMGIRIIGEISPEKGRYHGISKSGGVVVEPVAGQAADKAGLQVFDIITRIDGKAVSTGIELQEYIFEKKIGEQVDVEIIRLKGLETNQIEHHTIRITLSQ